MTKRTHYVLLVPLAILSVCLLISAGSSAPANDESNASSAEGVKKLIGAWQLKSTKNPGSPSGLGTRLKLFTGTHWTIIQPDPNSGKIVFQHGGHYLFDGIVLSETIDFAGESTSSLIGKTFNHDLRFKDDILEQIDPDGEYNETWERAKAVPGK